MQLKFLHTINKLDNSYQFRMGFKCDIRYKKFCGFKFHSKRLTVVYQKKNINEVNDPALFSVKLASGIIEPCHLECYI